jgi:hypothetical protein
VRNDHPRRAHDYVRPWGSRTTGGIIIDVVMVDGEEATWIPLSRRPWGIETFRVEGTLDSSAVRARWDGRWVSASTHLCRRVAMAIAVEEVFAEVGLAGPLGDDGRGTGPEEVLLAVLDCCDSIDVLEYELGGDRRVISSSGSLDDVDISRPAARPDRT